MQNQFTDITRLAQGLVLNNYNSIQFGEPELQNALSHNASLLYRSFNLFNYTNVFARVAYTSNIDQIRSLTNFESIIRTSTFLIPILQMKILMLLGVFNVLLVK